RCSTCWGGWWTSRWCRRTGRAGPAGRCATGCWRRCARTGGGGRGAGAGAGGRPRAPPRASRGGPGAAGPPRPGPGRGAGGAQAAWLDRLEADHDNLRQALRWLIDRRAAAAGMRLATALRLFWLVRGFRREGRGWLAALLALPDAPGGAAPPGVRGRALLAA